MIYIIESPLINFIKLGFWSSKLRDLRSRYTTYYGKDIVVWYIEENSILTEKKFHCLFEKIRLDGELYPKEKFDYIRNVIETTLSKKFDSHTRLDKLTTKLEKINIPTYDISPFLSKISTGGINMELVQNNFISSEDMYNQYKMWCKDNKSQCINKIALGKMISKYVKSVRYSNKGQTRGWDLNTLIK